MVLNQQRRFFETPDLMDRLEAFLVETDATLWIEHDPVRYTESPAARCAPRAVRHGPLDGARPFSALVDE